MKYLILGNGPAGVIAAETLRRADPAGQIILVGSESEPPYSRMAIPYLLEGNIDESGTYLRKTPKHFDKLGITQRVGRVVEVDAEKHSVSFEDGSRESYDRLLIATGSHPVRPAIPGIELPQVRTCWTLEDARAIAALAKKGSRVVQLGAGFIGCIIMQALAERGVKLTVVEMGDRMVPRMMTPTAGNMIRKWVEQKGISVRTEAGVQHIATGKDSLILTPLKEFLAMANKDRNSKIIILYVEPGGTYERDAIEYMKTHKFSKPLLVYVAGAFAEGKNISLGHAGAVVEGACTSSTDKMKLFDDYFGVPQFDPNY